MWKQIKRIAGTPAQAAKHPDPAAHADQLIENFTSRSSTDNLPDHVQTAQQALAPRRERDVELRSSEPDFTDTPFHFVELVRALSKYKKSAPGEDHHTYEMIDHAPADFKLNLLHLINDSWAEGRLPYPWKTAIIQPIPKKNAPDAPRPISLLSCLGKVMERMVHSRLKYKIGPLHKHIFGYKEGSSTTDAFCSLALIATDPAKTCKHCKPTAVFMDLEKAFKLTGRLPITEALIQNGVWGDMLALPSDYFEGRSAKVQFQRKLFRSLQLENGTPHALILSPTLFNILMEKLVDLPFDPSVRTVSYADDVVIFAGDDHSET